MQDFTLDFHRCRSDTTFAVLEGFHALKHALRFGAEIIQVVAVEPLELEQLATQLAPDLVGCFTRLAVRVPKEEFRRLSTNAHRTEVMAIAKRPQIDVEQSLAESAKGPIVYLEDPRNLGNVGATIRVAAAANAAGVLTSGANDPWDAAAIRGSAGLHYALPVAHVEQIPKSNRSLIAIDPEGDAVNYREIPNNSILAFGTERHGLSRDLLRDASARVSIPMRQGVSSLNLATSVAVLLFSGRGYVEAPESSGEQPIL